VDPESTRRWRWSTRCSFRVEYLTSAPKSPHQESKEPHRGLLFARLAVARSDIRWAACIGPRSSGQGPARIDQVGSGPRRLAGENLLPGDLPLPDKPNSYALYNEAGTSARAAAFSRRNPIARPNWGE
jgi:hypothetical protein